MWEITTLQSQYLHCYLWTSKMLRLHHGAVLPWKGAFVFMYAICVCCWSTAMFPWRGYTENTTNNHLCLTVIGLLQGRLPFYVRWISLQRISSHICCIVSVCFFSHTQKQPQLQVCGKIQFLSLPGCSERRAYRLFPHLHLSSDERGMGWKKHTDKLIKWRALLSHGTAHRGKVITITHFPTNLTVNHTEGLPPFLCNTHPVGYIMTWNWTNFDTLQSFIPTLTFHSFVYSIFDLPRPKRILDFDWPEGPHCCVGVVSPPPC